MLHTMEFLSSILIIKLLNYTSIHATSSLCLYDGYKFFNNLTRKDAVFNGQVWVTQPPNQTLKFTFSANPTS